MIFPVPGPSPGRGMKYRLVTAFSRQGRASHGRAPTTAAKGAIWWKFPIRFSRSRPWETKPTGSPNESWQIMSYANDLQMRSHTHTHTHTFIIHYLGWGQKLTVTKLQNPSLHPSRQTWRSTLVHCAMRSSTWPSSDFKLVRVNDAATHFHFMTCSSCLSVWKGAQFHPAPNGVYIRLVHASMVDLRQEHWIIHSQ